MKLVSYAKPVLADGKYTLSVTQTVTEPEKQTFTASSDFCVAGRAFTLAFGDVFDVYPPENECGNLSKMLPFITLEDKSFPWRWDMGEQAGGAPVPWVALIVVSSQEAATERDMSVDELQKSAPAGIYFPKEGFPETVLEQGGDVCHVLDLPVELYRALMPSRVDMTYLTHVKRVSLEKTEDEIAAKEGDFSVVLANRLIPAGNDGSLKSTVHLVSLIGFPETIPEGYDAVRLVSLFRWNVYCVRENTESFRQMIDRLRRNTGEIGFDRENEILRRAYVPKKHMTRSGETTYSLYRSPLIPYENRELAEKGSKATADGYLIYDRNTGVFDTSYAAAFQLGRLISLSSPADCKWIAALRRQVKINNHKKLLRANINRIDVRRLCQDLTKEREK